MLTARATPTRSTGNSSPSHTKCRSRSPSPARAWLACSHALVWTEGTPLHQQPLWLLFLDTTAKSVLFTWVFLHTRGSVLLATILHATTNLFVVSPVLAEGGSVALLLLAASAKWALVVVVIAVAGPGLAKGPRPEALPKAYQEAESLFTGMRGR